MAAQAEDPGGTPPMESHLEPSPNDGSRESDGDCLVAAHRGAPEPAPASLYGLVCDVARAGMMVTNRGV